VGGAVAPVRVAAQAADAGPAADAAISLRNRRS
jgi:hypothetical protein